MRLRTKLLTACACLFAAAPLHAAAEQTPVDRADPSVLEEELDEAEPTPRAPRRILETPERDEGRSAIAQPVVAGAIRIDGARAIAQAAFAPVVERYAGRTLAPNELRTLAAEIAAVARGRGYGLATAWIPPQNIENGVLRVRVDEGSIDAVEVTGSGGDAVRPRLAPLADGRPLPTAELERRLLVAGDVPGIRLGKARLARRNGRNVLLISAVRDRVEARAGLDNWGSSTAGPIRARLSVDVNAVLLADDRLSFDAVVTPLQPNEFALARAAYTMSVGTGGTEVTVGGYLARSEAGGALSDRDLDGRSSEVEAEIRHPLVRSRDASLWAGVAGKLRDSEQTRQDDLVRGDRTATATATLYGFHRSHNTRLRARLAYVQGLAILGATEAGDPLASRSDADGTFSKLELWSELEQRLPYEISLFVQMEAQLSGGSLLSSEEMGLGGRWFGRAWDYREFSGDRGIAGALEIRYDWKRPIGFVEAAQLYAYLDGGSVSNSGAGSGGGSLASAGAGFRLWLPRSLRAALQLGIPLTDGADADEEDRPRVSFTLDKRF